MKTQFSFTLIELICVVAILGILLLISIPNFFNAQTRAKVAWSLSNMRIIGASFELYRLDHNTYPHTNFFEQPRGYIGLTTPVSYIQNSTVFRDPFCTSMGNIVEKIHNHYPLQMKTYFKVPKSWGLVGHMMACEWWDEESRVVPDPEFFPRQGWALLSVGPDDRPGDLDPLIGFFFQWNNKWDVFYHPSNGLASKGDIIKWHGNTLFFWADEIDYL